MPSWTVGDIEITRVEDPDFELILPSDEATVATLQGAPWLHPHFVTDDWSLVIGSSATVVRTATATVLVDPFLAFDDPAKLGVRLQALRDAGVEADDVDVVVNTHVDGLGVNLLADGSPDVPAAPATSSPAPSSRPSGPAPTASGARRPFLPPGTTVRWRPATERERSSRASASRTHRATTPGTTWCGSRTAPRRPSSSGTSSSTRPRSRRPRSTTATSIPCCWPRPAAPSSPGASRPATLLVGPLFAAPGAGLVRSEGDTWRLEVDA